MPTGHTTGSIAQAVGGRLVGPSDLPIADLASMDQAGPQSLTFIRDRAFGAKWASSKGAAALVSDGVAVAGHDQATRALIHVADADLAMIKVLTMFETKPTVPDVGVHPTAVVDPSTKIGSGVRIGAFCVVGARTQLADGVTLMPRVTLGSDVVIGPGSVLYPGAVVYDRCTIGAQSVLHSNTNIGADGFGYRPAPDGRGLIKIPHVGTVRIGNGVEIGAGTCVDRGKFGATVVGDGAKLDNLVQIGHNCRIGRCAIVCGMTGVAGSAVVGDGAMIGGHVGITDNINVGAGAMIGAKSGVMTHVPAGEAWTGYPAVPHREFLRSRIVARRLEAMAREFARRSGASEGAAGEAGS